MATKTKKYPELNFDVTDLPGCCGIGVVYSFEEEGEYNWWGETTKTTSKYTTKKEQAEACYQAILKRTWKNGKWNDESYSYLQIALVSNYADKDVKEKVQLPELQQKLIDEGWTINMVFINPNHGNEVTVYSKYFPERNTDPYAEEEEEDEVF